jgi:hypothetical protein
LNAAPAPPTNPIPPPPPLAPPIKQDAPTSPEDVKLRPLPPPPFKAPTPYIQTDAPIKYQRDRKEKQLQHDRKEKQLQKRLNELQRQHEEVQRQIDELDIKRQQRVVKANIQKQLIERIPLAAKAFNAYDNVLQDAQLANTFLNTEPVEPPSRREFIASSYEEFQHLHSEPMKNQELEALQEIFDILDANPFGYTANISNIHNRELITPFFKEFMLKHIAPHSVNDKLLFKYQSRDGEWHTVSLRAIYEQLMLDLDSVGFEMRVGEDFDPSDTNGDITLKVGIITKFAFSMPKQMEAPKQTKEKKPRKARQGAFFPYIIKSKYATPRMIAQLNRCQIWHDVRAITASSTPSNCWAHQSK